MAATLQVFSGALAAVLPLNTPSSLETMTDDNAAEIITPEELKKAIGAVFKQAQTDVEFRKLCLENPAEAVYRISGKRLPANSTLSFSDPKESGA